MDIDEKEEKYTRGNGSHNIRHCLLPLQIVQDKVPARAVLYMLSFSGFLVSFMMRTDINIAIVAMVKHNPTAAHPQNSVNNSSELMYCYENNVPSDDHFNSSFEVGEFDWDTRTQTIILSSFYWCYVVSQVIGGILTEYFGSKVVFGYSQLATAICSLLIPQAAVGHYSAVVMLRSIQGTASGLTWPAMYALVGHWIPCKERSTFMSSFQGFSFGIGLTYPLCGVLIAHYGWRSVFYTTGSLGMVWCAVWWLLAFDAPSQHPRITQKELRYIQRTTGDTIVGRKDLNVPWGKILKSLPAWSIGITTFGRIWVHYTFIISGPLYMKTVLGFDIQTNGLMSGIPFLCSYFASVAFCYLADYLLTRNIMSLTNIRKLFTAIAQVIPGLLLLLVIHLQCNRIYVLMTWFIAITLITASYAGAMANIVDISPNFAGPVLAFAQTIHMSASFLSPLASGYFLQENTSLNQWKEVFQLSGIIAIFTYTSFQIFGTAQIQDWNNPQRDKPSQENNELLKESQPMTTVT